MTQLDINDPAIRRAIRDRIKQRVRSRVAGSAAASPQGAASPSGEPYKFGTAVQQSAATADFGPMPKVDASGMTPESEDYYGTGQPRHKVDEAVRDLYSSYPDRGDQFNNMEPRKLAELAVRETFSPATRPMPSDMPKPGADTFAGEFWRSATNEVARQFDVPNAPLVGPWLHKKAQEAELQAKPQGTAGFAGQTTGGLAGMASPNNFLETGGSIIFGGVVGKIAAPMLGKVASSLGNRAAKVLGQALEEASEEAVFAAMQQSGREDWENDPIGALKRVAAAAGIGGSVGAVMGGVMGSFGDAKHRGSIFDAVYVVGDIARTSARSETINGAPPVTNQPVEATEIDTDEPELPPDIIKFGEVIPAQPVDASREAPAIQSEAAPEPVAAPIQEEVSNEDSQQEAPVQQPVQEDRAEEAGEEVLTEAQPAARSTDYDSMKYPELQKIAKERGIKSKQRRGLLIR